MTDLTINRMTPSVKQLSIVTLSSTGNGLYVYCAAFLSTEPVPASISNIYRVNHMIFTPRQNVGVTTVVLVNITSLLPVTQYSVYCAAKTTHGIEMTLSAVQQTRKNTATTCCKEIIVSLPQTTTVEGVTLVKGVTLTLSNLPTASSVIAIVSFNRVPGSQTIGNITAQPAQFTITSSSSLLSERTTAVVPLGVGVFELSVGLQGTAASEYSIIYATSRVFTVRAANTVPLLPRLLQARFSNSGSTVLLSFDAPTDQRGLYGVFICNSLLLFTGADATKCQWLDSKQLLIYPVYKTADTTLQIGDAPCECTKS